jgi:hypothetical protein
LIILNYLFVKNDMLTYVNQQRFLPYCMETNQELKSVTKSLERNKRTNMS